MAQIIGLPKLSPTMEEGVLVRWVKREGDAVEPGDLIAEVETDKANMDFNLEDEGTLLKLLVTEGETVALGAPVAILGDPGEDIAALVAEASGQQTGAAPAPAAAPPAPATVTPPAAVPSPAPTPTPLPSSPTATTAGRLLASPLAKTLALELGVDLRGLTGTGPGGRIIERDVRAFAAGSQTSADAPAPQPPVAAAPEPSESTALAVVRPSAPATIPPSDAYVDRPLPAIRKRIAERMTQAKRDVPHFYLTREFNAADLLHFRARLNKLLGDRGKVSVNDLIVKGTALALRRVPDVNVAFLGDAIRYYTQVHIGIAVATERGLVTPVVRDADLKGIGVIAVEVKDLAERARDRRLKTHEIQGSTFTVSNLGMFGIRHFEAIINPPEAAILAVGGIVETPVVTDDDKLVVHKRMSLTLSCDHRVVDGALGAQYLAELVDLLEHPESLAL